MYKRQLASRYPSFLPHIIPVAALSRTCRLAQAFRDFMLREKPPVPVYTARTVWPVTHCSSASYFPKRRPMTSLNSQRSTCRNSPNGMPAEYPTRTKRSSFPTTGTSCVASCGTMSELCARPSDYNALSIEFAFCTGKSMSFIRTSGSVMI